MRCSICSVRDAWDSVSDEGASSTSTPPLGQSRQESWGRFEESWEIIQRLWRGETLTFHGRYYHLDQVKLSVLPVQQPFPRYWFSVLKEESFTMRGRAA